MPGVGGISNANPIGDRCSCAGITARSLHKSLAQSVSSVGWDKPRSRNFGLDAPLVGPAAYSMLEPTTPQGRIRLVCPGEYIWTYLGVRCGAHCPTRTSSQLWLQIHVDQSHISWKLNPVLTPELVTESTVLAVDTSLRSS